MLKFRFRKKELRRRSNSCPNLDSCSTPIDDGVQDKEVMNKHNSCYIENGSENESDILSPTKKERLHAQRSIRLFKKREKEQQENVEKNMLSDDDFWRKLDSLKRWLHDEQGSKEVENMQSPKLRSHFKKFIKLWNKRKLPLKYYKNCCVDVEAESSSADIHPNNHSSQSPPLGDKLHGQNAFTFDFLPHSTLKDLPSYHHFPFLEESAEKMLSSSSASLMSAQTVCFQDGVKEVDGFKDISSGNNGSPFSTFGKSICDPHTSTSLLAKQIDIRASKRKDSKSKNKDGLTSPSSCTSPKKFATISRSAPASSIFKSSSPQVHAVVSPTCPYPAPFSFNRCNRDQRGSNTDRDTKNPSPAYMCVQDAIPFESSSPSPKYWQVGFDDVFEEEPLEPHYSTLSPLFKGKKSIHTDKSGEYSSLSRNPSSLSRRRSKSMEDIYAVPSRLMMTMDMHKEIASPLRENISLTMPPVPMKKFTPTSSLVSVDNDSLVRSQNPSSHYSLESVDSSERLEIFDPSEKPLLSMYSSENSLSVDMGYQSGRFEESSGSNRSVSSFNSTTGIKSLVNSKIHRSPVGVKRRSEERETNVDEIELPKKNKPSHQTSLDLNNKIMNVVSEKMLEGDAAVDLNVSNASTLKLESSLKEESPLCQIPKKSILTGSLNPTTRTPKTENDTRDKKDRLSILQIKVLDKSPTFPRRKIKRRSSSLVVTPGKNLTFGNKGNGRMAMSTPRRVSFAKNVKKGDDDNATPTRKSLSSSASKVSVRGSICSNSIARQCQDKADFESFWAAHDNTNIKPNSPVNDSANSPKKWSPSKSFSPSKITTFLNTGSAVQSQSSFGSSNMDRNVEKGRLIKSLSPKKLLSSLQKKSPSSSCETNNSTPFSSQSYHFDKPCFNEIELTSGIPKPRSILKVPHTITSPARHATYSIRDNGSSQSKRNNTSNTSHNVPSRRSGESNLDHCRSPPRLGVASLKAAHFAATHNMSSLPRSKQQLLFDASISNKTMLSEVHGTSQNPSFDTKSCIVLPREESHYLAPPNNTLREMQSKSSESTIDEQIYDQHESPTQEFETDIDDKTNLDTLMLSETLPPPPSFLLNDTCEDIETSYSPLSSQTNGENSNTAICIKQCFEANGESTPILDAGSLKSKSFSHQWDSVVFDTNDEGKNDTLSQLGQQLSSWNDNRDDYCMESNNVDSRKDSQNEEMHSSYPSQTLSQHGIVDTVRNNEIDNVLISQGINEVSGNAYHTASENFSNAEDNLNVDRSDDQMAISSPRPMATPEDSDKQLSRAVLERIKSFRSSPKVEENDGWITERRRSRGSKSKSFRNSPNHSFIRSPLQTGANSVSPAPELEDQLNASHNLPAADAQQGIFLKELSYTNDDLNDRSNYQSEQETGTTSVLRIKHPPVSVSHDRIVDADKSNDTENTSSPERKYRGGRGDDLGDFDSELSMKCSGSGNCKNSDELSPTDSCPIYDVPKIGIHIAKPMQNDFCQDISQPQITDNNSGSRSPLASKENNQPKTQNKVALSLDNTDPRIVGSSVQSGLATKESNNKENAASPSKTLKPKPLVRPKPKPSPKQATVQQKHSNYSPLFSSTVRNISQSPQPLAKRRSSVIKRESISSRISPQSSISTSKSIKNNLIARPVVRKRSSVANREHSSIGKSFKNSPITTNTSFRLTPQKSENKRESITPSRRKRTSLEKCGRRSSGVSSGPEQTSFAQRRKFFQQLQASSCGSTTSVVLKPKPSVQSSSSFLDKSQPKPSFKANGMQRP